MQFGRADFSDFAFNIRYVMIKDGVYAKTYFENVDRLVTFKTRLPTSFL